MNRDHLPYLALMALALLALGAVLFFARACGPQPVVVTPPTVTPVTPTIAPPTVTLVPPTETPTATATPTSTPTPTLVPATPTPALPVDTKGDVPATTPEAGGDPTDQTLINLILAGLMALLSFISGGGLSKLLDRLPLWRDWHPSDATYKTFATFVLTFALGVLVTWLVNYGVPTYWQFIPEFVQYLLAAVIVFYTSQKVQELDKARAARAQALLDQAVHTQVEP